MVIIMKLIVIQPYSDKTNQRGGKFNKTPVRLIMLELFSAVILMNQLAVIVRLIVILPTFTGGIIKNSFITMAAKG